ncbi:MAG: 2'-5' RNA ligase family protein [Spirochaetales bacterium]|nr:2'-5' RNA ligase family protein [Spirochaetales bacterium]
MYVWTALYIEDELEEVRDRAIGIGEDLKVKCPLTILPLHISLKISFQIEDSRLDECVGVLCDYFSTLGPFSVEVEGYEHSPGVVWVRMKENARLAEIHARLDELMMTRFGAKPHEFDLSFIYHATLFFDEDSKLEPAFQAIKTVPLPGRIHARDFLVGTSETGKPGTYSVYRHSHLGTSVDVKEKWEKLEGS